MSPTVVGIDPGLQRTGYAVIFSDGSSPLLREAGVLTTESRDPLSTRLRTIHDGLEELLSEFHPDVMVVEKLYSHYNHPQTAVVMGHARGVVFLSAAAHGIPVKSYASTRIKKSVTGNGHASKAQIQRTIKALLKLSQVPQPADVADAIAVALCHIESER